MNPGTLYLYEYESRIRIRTVGFIRIMRTSPSCCLLQIHARHLDVNPGSRLLLYAFYREDKDTKDEHIIAGKAVSLTCIGRAVSTRLSVPESCFPTQYPLEVLDGFLLLPDTEDNKAPSRFWMASDSSSPSIDIQRLISTTAPPESTENDPPDISTTAPPENAENDPPDISTTAPPENSESDPPNISTTAPPEIIQNPSVESHACTDPQHLPLPENVHLLSRKDLTVLPRRLWFLANNAFLLHGCHNYGHLLLFSEHGRAWLGIPGTYSQQEARAADYFGFPRFTYDYQSVAIQNVSPDFGHWCRCLGPLSGDQKFPFIS